MKRPNKELKKGDSFLCREDRPTKSRYSEFDNTGYNQRVNALDSEYWKRLKLCGITPTKYSWKFGDDFADTCFKGVEDDMAITIYTK